MNTMRNIRVLMSGLALACASTAAAQTATTPAGKFMPLGGKAFVNVSVGGQTQARTMENETSFPIYGQTATAATTVTVDGGPLFDLTIGYRIRQEFQFKPLVDHYPGFGVALGYARFSNTGSASGAATIPNPTFFNRPAAVTINEVDAKRTDNNISILLVGFIPITDKIELSVSLGPSFFSVHQDMFAAMTAANVPAGTQNLNTTIQGESGVAKGVNIGFDIAYSLGKQTGVGGFLRYNGASVDLDDQADVKAGGLQMGLGARLRF